MLVCVAWVCIYSIALVWMVLEHMNVELLWSYVGQAEGEKRMYTHVYNMVDVLHNIKKCMHTTVHYGLHNELYDNNGRYKNNALVNVATH